MALLNWNSLKDLNPLTGPDCKIKVYIWKKWVDYVTNNQSDVLGVVKRRKSVKSLTDHNNEYHTLLDLVITDCVYDINVRLWDEIALSTNVALNDSSFYGFQPAVVIISSCKIVLDQYTVSLFKEVKDYGIFFRPKYSVSTPSDDDIMEQIDDYKYDARENLEKSMTNFNVNTAMMMDQILQLSRDHKENSANFTMQVEILLEEVGKLRIEGRMIREEMSKII
ncbi:hypothetical protein AgCh_008198 [Apium graveolens]